MRGGWTYTPRATKEYMAHVALCASNAARKAGWEMVGRVPVTIRLKFVFEIPKSRKELKLGDPHLQKPDKDNCEKGILDGCTGVLWKDDSSGRSFISLRISVANTYILARLTWDIGSSRLMSTVGPLTRIETAPIITNTQKVDKGINHLV